MRLVEVRSKGLIKFIIKILKYWITKFWITKNKLAFCEVVSIKLVDGDYLWKFMKSFPCTKANMNLQDRFQYVLKSLVASSDRHARGYHIYLSPTPFSVYYSPDRNREVVKWTSSLSHVNPSHRVYFVSRYLHANLCIMSHFNPTEESK